MSTAPAEAAFHGARALITGGMGFLGSSLAIRLVALGSEVTLFDAMSPEGGANPRNVEAIRGKVRIVQGDLRDGDAVKPLLAGQRYLFNLAALTSHLGSMAAPLEDLDVNCRAQLALLEMCRVAAPEIVIVHAGTRQIYGKPDRLPVAETHPLRPPDVNGVSKMAAEALHLLYHRVYGLAATSLRLTNTYGPRMRIKDARQTFLGLWLRRLLEGDAFEVWEGEQRRDLTYVEDAVDAFLLAAAKPATRGRAFNIGGGGSLTLLALAQALVTANGGGRFEVKSFPPERKRIDIGDYEADDRLFRHTTGWQPRVSLADGLARSLAYFRAHLRDYL